MSTNTATKKNTAASTKATAAPIKATAEKKAADIKAKANAEQKAAELKAKAKAGETKASEGTETKGEAKPETATKGEEKKVAEPKPKRVTLKSQAVIIFNEVMVRRVAGEFKDEVRPNSVLRKLVLDRLMAELNVTLASAATMYNTLMKEGELAAGVKGETLGLGRDPAVEKPKKEKKEKVKAEEAAPEGNQELTEQTDDVPVDDANAEEEEAVA